MSLSSNEKRCIARIEFISNFLNKIGQRGILLSEIECIVHILLFIQM